MYVMQFDVMLFVGSICTLYVSSIYIISLYYVTIYIYEYLVG